MVSKAVKEFQAECELYKRNSAVLDCLNGDFVQVNNKEDVMTIVNVLHNCGPHNGVVVGGCDPWFVSTVRKQ